MVLAKINTTTAVRVIYMVLKKLSKYQIIEITMVNKATQRSSMVY